MLTPLTQQAFIDGFILTGCIVYDRKIMSTSYLSGYFERMGLGLRAGKRGMKRYRLAAVWDVMGM